MSQSFRGRSFNMPRFQSIAVLAVLAVCGTAAAADSGSDLLSTIKWLHGPATAEMSNANISVPEGFLFADAKDSQKLLKAMGNLLSDREEGLLAPETAFKEGGGAAWFVVFEFNKTGYVKDEEKNAIDAPKLLEGLKEGNVRGNKERERQGLEKLELVGWAVEPHYDDQTHNLEWGLLLRNAKGGMTVNYNVRLLGRRGVMECTLVLSQAELDAALPAFRTVLTGYEYKEGERYAEWRPGDAIAKYGLTALIAGGALAVAAKTGFLQKFWKFLVLIVIGAASWIKKAWNRMFGKEYADGTGGGQDQKQDRNPPA
jgi:uncharacterized membrane-anchored protein